MFGSSQNFPKIYNVHVGVFLQILNGQIHARFVRNSVALQMRRHIFGVKSFLVRRNNQIILYAALFIIVAGFCNSFCHPFHFGFRKTDFAKIIYQRITVRHLARIIKRPTVPTVNGRSVVQFPLHLKFSQFFQKLLPSGKSIIVIGFKLPGKIKAQLFRLTVQRAVVQKCRIA